MKTSTTAALAGVLVLAAVGGGTAYALNQPEPVETPAAVSTETPSPEDTSHTPTAEPTPEATEPVETTTPTYSEAENDFLYGARQIVSGYADHLTDTDMLEYGYAVCEMLESGTAIDEADSGIPELPAGLQGSYVQQSRDYLCPLG